MDPTDVPIVVASITHEVVPYLGLNDSARTDPIPRCEPTSKRRKVRPWLTLQA